MGAALHPAEPALTPRPSSGSPLTLGHDKKLPVLLPQLDLPFLSPSLINLIIFY